jgi:hypothetical protein
MSDGDPHPWLMELEQANEDELSTVFSDWFGELHRPDEPEWVAKLEAAGFGEELDVLKPHRRRALSGGESPVCEECGGSWIRRTLTEGAVVVGCREVASACQVLEDCNVLPADLVVEREAKP